MRWTACLVIIACSDRPEEPRDAATGSYDAGASEDASTDDSGIGEDGGDDDGGAWTATPLPIARDAITQIGAPGGYDVASTALELANGDVVIAYESYAADFSTGGLYRYDFDRSLGPDPIAVSTRAVVGNPSFVSLDRDYLYFAASDGIQAPASLARVPFDGDVFGAAETVYLPSAGWSMLAWPRFYALIDRRVASAYRNSSSHPEVAFTDDGRTFASETLVAPEGHALAALGAFGGGTFAYTYQVQGTVEPMVSFFRLSADGSAWSDPVRVTDASSNVHDTTSVLRADGNLDLYYIYPFGPLGFVLFRRALAPDGTLGPEERVTEPEVGEISKPEVLRRRDGRLVVMFAEISQRAFDGTPSEQRLSAFELSGDAPSP